MLTYEISMLTYDLIMLHVNMIILHGDMNKSQETILTCITHVELFHHVGSRGMSHVILMFNDFNISEILFNLPRLPFHAYFVVI